MPNLSLTQALQILEAARREAARLRARPLAYAVVDAGGHLLALQRDERAGPLRAAIAQNKAWGVIALGVSSAELARQISGHTDWWIGISGTAGGRLVPSPGGLAILDGDGEVVGAIGISGEKSVVDEAIGATAVRSVGLTIADEAS